MAVQPKIQIITPGTHHYICFFTSFFLSLFNKIRVIYVITHIQIYIHDTYTCLIFINKLGWRPFSFFLLFFSMNQTRSSILARLICFLIDHLVHGFPMLSFWSSINFYYIFLEGIFLIFIIQYFHRIILQPNRQNIFSQLSSFPFSY